MPSARPGQSAAGRAVPRAGLRASMRLLQAWRGGQASRLRGRPGRHGVAPLANRTSSPPPAWLATSSWSSGKIGHLAAARPRARTLRATNASTAVASPWSSAGPALREERPSRYDRSASAQPLNRRQTRLPARRSTGRRRRRHHLDPVDRPAASGRCSPTRTASIRPTADAVAEHGFQAVGLDQGDHGRLPR